MEQMLRVGGTDVAHTVTGSGPGLVLLHGASAGKDVNWGFLAERLADRFTSVVLDLPGSGATRDDQGEELSYDAVIAQVLAVARTAVEEPFHLLGYSLGAHLAAAVAAAEPAAIASLTAIVGWVRPDAYLLLEADLWQRLFRVDPELFARLAVMTGSHPDYLASAPVSEVESLVQAFVAIAAHGTARQVEVITRTDLTGRLAAITAPTHVIALSADRQVPIAHSRALAAGITGATFTEVDAGHIAPWQHGEDLYRAVETYLTTLPTPAAVDSAPTTITTGPDAGAGAVAR